MRVQVAPGPAQTVPSNPMPAVLMTVRGHEQSPHTVNKDRRYDSLLPRNLGVSFTTSSYNSILLGAG